MGVLNSRYAGVNARARATAARTDLLLLVNQLIHFVVQAIAQVYIAAQGCGTRKAKGSVNRYYGRKQSAPAAHVDRRDRGVVCGVCGRGGEGRCAYPSSILEICSSRSLISRKYLMNATGRGDVNKGVGGRGDCKHATTPTAPVRITATCVWAWRAARLPPPPPPLTPPPCPVQRLAPPPLPLCGPEAQPPADPRFPNTEHSCAYTKKHQKRHATTHAPQMACAPALAGPHSTHVHQGHLAPHPRALNPSK